MPVSSDLPPLVLHRILSNAPRSMVELGVPGRSGGQQHLLGAWKDTFRRPAFRDEWASPRSPIC